MTTRAIRFWVYGLLALAGVFAWLRESVPLGPTARMDDVPGDFLDNL